MRGSSIQSGKRLLAAIAVAGTGLAMTTNGAHAATTRPIVVSLTATSTHGRPLPATGAPVKVTVRVKNAKTCTFLAQRTARSSVYPVKTVPCSSGHASLTIGPIPNLRSTMATLEYGVRVKSATGKTLTRSVFIDEAGVPPPPTVNLQISNQALTSSGGDVDFTFTATDAKACTLTATPALWPGANPMTVPCDGTYATTVAPASQLPQEWKIVFTATGVSGSATAQVPLSENAAPGPAGPITLKSTNWAGYNVLSGGPVVTQVAGDWIVPITDCTKTPNAGAASWVGTGGSSNPDRSSTGDLLQTGVTTDCVAGVEEVYAWWELYPSNPNHSWPFQMNVSPGDHISASVFEAPGGAYWETRVDDLTTGQSGIMRTGVGYGVMVDSASTFQATSTLTFPYSGGTSAEWIQEEYGISDTGLVSLVQFGSVTFYNLATSIAGWGLTPGESITLVDAGGNPLALTSVPIGVTTGFSVANNG